MKHRNDAIILLFLTTGAILVHGYHPFAEDAEIYLPGIEKILDPRLFPKGAEFFQSHAHLTLFPNLIALSVRLTHLSLVFMLFFWHVLSVFLLLLACWQLSGRLFAEARARWAGVAMVASLLTLPVAGTALYIMDQYVVNRNFAAFAGVFAITRVLEKRYVPAGLWLLFAAAIHPLMVAFVFSFCLLLVVQEKFRTRQEGLVPRAEVVGCLLPISFLFQPTSPAYHEAMRFHVSHFLANWAWYEWLGLIAPALLFAWFARLARSRQRGDLERVCKAVLVYWAVYFVFAGVVAVPQSLEAVARLQPLRSLHLLYIFLLLIGGGLLGEYLLGRHIWRWCVLFLPICAGMFLAQRDLFPASTQVEWPWSAPRNPWVQAFLWVRSNTPSDAFFALDPLYMEVHGEDTNGFRALAERSRLADATKDSGAVSMFPPLATEWLEQFRAVQNWRNFGPQDFQQLHARYGVDWVVMEASGSVPGNCPYHNRAVAVCRLE